MRLKNKKKKLFSHSMNTFRLFIVDDHPKITKKKKSKINYLKHFYLDDCQNMYIIYEDECI